LAQAQVGSGHALDASLEVGAAGYNSRVISSGPLTAPRYVPPAQATGRDLGTDWRYGTPQSAWSPYAPTTNYQTYINDRRYRADWQGRRGGYSGYAQPVGQVPNNELNTRIDGRVGG
jgi:hypothetical protein